MYHFVADMLDCLIEHVRLPANEKAAEVAIQQVSTKVTKPLLRPAYACGVRGGPRFPLVAKWTDGKPDYRVRRPSGLPAPLTAWHIATSGQIEDKKSYEELRRLTKTTSDKLSD